MASLAPTLAALARNIWRTEDSLIDFFFVAFLCLLLLGIGADVTFLLRFFTSVLKSFDESRLGFDCPRIILLQRNNNIVIKINLAIEVMS
jgi:hypothetical protein